MFFFLLVPVLFKQKRIIKSFCIFILFFILGSLPSIKNKIFFDIFSNSSWTGLNAAQATGYDREEWPLCSFNKDKITDYNIKYKNFLNNKPYLNSDILNDKSFNDLGYIYKSLNCDQKAKKHLLLNFTEITKQKIQRFISVHAHLSIDFAFKPKNWKTKFYKLEELNNNFFFKLITLIFFGSIYLFYLYLILDYGFKKNRNFSDHFLLINLLLYSYLIIVSFYGSTWEQERMRYTGYSFIFISISIILKKLTTNLNKMSFFK